MSGRAEQLLQTVAFFKVEGARGQGRESKRSCAEKPVAKRVCSDRWQHWRWPRATRTWAASRSSDLNSIAPTAQTIAPMTTAIAGKEFALLQRFIFEAAGITMSPSKKALVMSRLSKRLDLRRLPTFAEYFKVLSSGQDAQEVQVAIDLLTTNETYFFREPKHFDLLREQAELARGRRATV